MVLNHILFIISYICEGKCDDPCYGKDWYMSVFISFLKWKKLYIIYNSFHSYKLPMTGVWPTFLNCRLKPTGWLQNQFSGSQWALEYRIEIIRVHFIT